MKILFISTENNSVYYQFIKHNDVLDDIYFKETNHSSLVKRSLLLYYLNKNYNHSTDIAVTGNNDKCYKVCNIIDPNNINYDEYDVVFLFGWQGLQYYEKLNPKYKGLLLVWFEGGNVNLFKKINRDPTHIAWASRLMMETYKDMFPKVKHSICPHASTITPIDEIPTETINKSLYFGRLPKIYKLQVIQASKFLDVDSYSLWVEKNITTGIKRDDIYNLRPGKFSENDLKQAQDIMGKNVNVKAAINIALKYRELSRYKFGICPTSNTNFKTIIQLPNASKFYDYIALGIPVLIAESCPEAEYVNDKIGAIYKINDLTSIKNAVDKCCKLSDDITARKYILQYAKENHSYECRAKVLHEFINE